MLDCWMSGPSLYTPIGIAIDIFLGIRCKYYRFHCRGSIDRLGMRRPSHGCSYYRLARFVLSAYQCTDVVGATLL